ncbi:hypothetical protein LCGC14_1020410 [marine sediment metagenome]|uniref:HNH endonuclease n=1 Tax=marine sediment metagenome TaxID=412755 RepID=A0A0F9QFM9_9ZZZZ
MKLKLAIEPIPASTWGRSLANLLPQKEWDKIRFECYKDAGDQCSICGDVSYSLHCHEQWAFDNRKKVQRLVGLECCCEICHDVHHFGRCTQVKTKQYLERLVRHWCKINGKTRQDFILHQNQVFGVNKKRANIYYIVKVGKRILA